MKHHFLSILEPTEVYTVVDFKRQADSVIQQIHNENKLPIVVGGTYYYIESILYDKLISTEEGDQDVLTLTTDGVSQANYTEQDLENPDHFFRQPIRTFGFDDVDSVKLHNLLRQVDEEAANRLHPNDKRKIVRALQVYQKTNRKYSDLIDEQHREGGGEAKISGKLRFPNSLILNLDVEKEVLHRRIDQRIGLMMENGLLDELTRFYEEYNRVAERKKDYDILANRKGIFQVIGFKEFADYFNCVYKHELNGRPVTNGDLLNDEQLKQKLINRGLNNLKTITKKYSKTQADWFKNRFLSNLNRRPTPPIFNLNANDLDQWNERVLEPSAAIVEHVLIKGEPCDRLPPHLGQLKASELHKQRNPKKLRYCKYCDKSMVDEVIWRAHVESKGHRENRRQWRAANRLSKRIDLKLVSGIGLAVLLVGLLVGYRLSR